jgi:diguanylate cyclase (GGDEF)-like protein/PAS domain S-box-containing protein
MSQDEQDPAEGAAAAEPATNETADSAPTLRQRAEARLQGLGVEAADGLEDWLPAAGRRALHELRVHQIELEMQNEELRQAQLVLDALRARYFELYELAPAGYCSVNAEGLIVEANLGAATLLGVTRGRLIGQPFSRFMAQDDADSFYLRRREILATAQPQTFELRLCRPEGQCLWVHVSATAASEGQGGAFLYLVLVDISERKLAEDVGREQQESFRLIAENLDGFVAILDHEGRRVYNSPSYTRLVGERDIRGSSSFEEVHPDDRARVIKAFRETVASGVGQPLEYRFLRADGGVCLLESRSGVIRDAAGRCKQVVVVAQDITERRLAEARIHHLAFHDPLTQLANRLTLMDRLQQGMAASKRSGCHGALLFLDLDNFKSVNDRHGHAAGDLLLIEAATRLSGCVRAVDTVARFGGDEFVVLLSDLPAAATEACAQARQVAEKIRHALAQPYRLTIRQAGQADTGIEHQCTASIGVALFMDHAASADDLLKWADAAMYQAKEAGRNRIAFHAALRPGRNPRQVSGRRRVNGEFDPPGNRWWREQATGAVVDALYARYPSLARRFGPGGRQACAADIQGHLDALDASVVTGQPGLFAEYAVWLKDVLASRGAPGSYLAESFELLAGFLGEHLPAEDGGHVCPLLRATSDALRQKGLPARSLGARVSPLADASRYRKAALGGRQKLAQKLMRELLQEGLTLTEASVRLIQPAMVEVGELWQGNRISVAQEHLATAISETVIARAYLQATFAAPVGRTAILAGVTGNRHTLGLRMVSDAFETIGWDVLYLGGDVPIIDLIRQIDASPVDVLGLSLSLPAHLVVARETAQRLRAELGNRCPTILMGGLATRFGERIWRSLAADAWAADALQIVEQGGL